MRWFCLAFLVALLCACQPHQSQHPAPQSLNGLWHFDPELATDLAPIEPSFDHSHWPHIQVPGNWFSQGFDTHGAHWYRTEFEWTPSQQHSTTALQFEGVDYQAEVWLNGHYLGGHQGYFAQFELDASHALISGTNVLAVKVNSPLESQNGPSWSLHKTLIKGVLGHHDTRAGGAWSERGQEQNTGGIWGQVNLISRAEVPITGSHWQTPIGANGPQGQLALNYRSSRTLNGEWQIKLKPINFDGPTHRFQFKATLEVGEHQTTIHLPPDGYQLWWPAERGQPNLYQLKAEFLSRGKVAAQYQRRVGFRSVDYDGQLGRWTINGQPLFLRGTNYIAHQYLSLADHQLLQQDLRLMQRANINAVRVHAHILPQRFYDLADEMGMLVWQDFPLQWGYLDSPAFHRQAEVQLKQMVDQFHHHPSIITWSAHNEPPWDADWMQYRYPDYDPNQNRELDLRLYRQLRNLDNSRPSFALSRTAEHPWYGWYGGKWQDYGKPTQEKLITEFGAQALPDAPILRQLLGAPDDWPSLPDDWSLWQFHNFQPHETFELAKVERGADALALIENTQRYQAKLTRYAAESYRRQKYQPVGGIFQFMFVEHWPSMNWGIMDYKRNPKPGYHALAQAFQPLLPSIVHHQSEFSVDEPVPLPVHIINDHLNPFNDAQLTLSLLKEGSLVEHKQQQLSIAPDSVSTLPQFPNRKLKPGNYRLNATLYDQQGNKLASSHFDFEVQL
ncbi:glycosyl hydrolase 2 galactose-binding domain-containing protein [Ferrimonas aestuarii]|nr:glycoside hydrolase family 2 TIM barrel-domain containing protein [Ferrimonas aestuarii]